MTWLQWLAVIGGVVYVAVLIWWAAVHPVSEDSNDYDHWPAQGTGRGTTNDKAREAEDSHPPKA